MRLKFSKSGIVAFLFHYRWSASILLIVLIDISTYLAFSRISSQSIVTFQDKLLHAIGFMILFTVGYVALALDLFPRSKFPSWRLITLNFAVWLGYSLFMEYGQKFIAYREFSYFDLVANMVGMVLGLVLIMWLRPQRCPRRRR